MRVRAQVLFSLMAVMPITAGVSQAETKSPAEQFAGRFASFCLDHRLTKVDLLQRTRHLRIEQERVISVDGFLKIVWRDPASRDHLRYSFDMIDQPPQKFRSVGCDVGEQNVPVASVVTALEKSSGLGKANDTDAASLVARKAGWFFIKDGEPNWVSVITFPFGNGEMVVVGISTHQRLSP